MPRRRFVGALSAIVLLWGTGSGCAFSKNRPSLPSHCEQPWVPLDILGAGAYAAGAAYAASTLDDDPACATGGCDGKAATAVFVGGAIISLISAAYGGIQLTSDKCRASDTDNTPQDIESADLPEFARIYLDKCSRGEASACRQLGLAYVSGDRIQRSQIAGSFFLSKACSARDVESCMALGDQAQRKHDLQLARKWFSDACGIGSHFGCERVAMLDRAPAPDSMRVADAAPGPTPDPPQAPPPPPVDPREPSPSEKEPSFQLTGTGSCFAISSDGLIATAAHVVDGSDAIGIRFGKEDFFDAKIVASSSAIDMAVLKIQRKTKDYLPPSTGEGSDIGERVFTIGFPEPQRMGFEPKFIEGTIGATSASGDLGLYQLQLPVLFGNSGGALVSESGILRGVVISKANEGDHFAATGATASTVSYASKIELISLLLEKKYFIKKPKVRSRATAIALANKAACLVATLAKSN